jgi:D-alanyl-D-alanine carboxypeptidase
LYSGWVWVWVWVKPLPAIVQEQVFKALNHESDGIIVYVGQAGKPPELYAAGWHDRKK